MAKDILAEGHQIIPWPQEEATGWSGSIILLGGHQNYDLIQDPFYPVKMACREEIISSSWGGGF